MSGLIYGGVRALGYGVKAYNHYRQNQLFYNTVGAGAGYAVDAFRKDMKRKNSIVFKDRSKKRKQDYSLKSKKKYGGGNNVVTQQRDVRSRGRKRMSKKGRKWKQFVRKVDKAVNYSDELCTFVENSNALFTSNFNPGRNVQNPFATSVTGDAADMRLGVYVGGNSGVKRMMNDIRVQVDNITSTLFTAKQLGNAQFINFWIKACNISFGLENTSGAITPADGQQIFVDVYECVSNQTMDTANASYLGAQTAWNNCLLNSVNPGGATGAAAPGFTKNTASTAGVTPYNAPDFGKYWKITKSTRLTLNNGARMNYTASGYRGFVKGPELLGSQQVEKKKVKDFIIVVNPTFNNPTLTGTTRLCNVQWSKTYYIGTNLPGRDAPISGTYTYV